METKISLFQVVSYKTPTLYRWCFTQVGFCRLETQTHQLSPSSEKRLFQLLLLNFIYYRALLSELASSKSVEFLPWSQGDTQWYVLIRPICGEEATQYVPINRVCINESYNLQQLFQEISVTYMFDFLHEVGLFYRI